MKTRWTLRRWILAWYSILIAGSLVMVILLALPGRDRPAPVNPALDAAASMDTHREAPTGAQGKMGGGPEIRWGSLASLLPTRMRVGETRIVRVALDPRPGVEIHLPGGGAAGEGDMVSKEVPLGNTMQAKLTGSGFDIVPITAEQQAVLAGLPSEWSWDVTPKTHGKQRLQLVVNGTFTLPTGGEAEKTVYSRAVTVEVASNFGYSFRRTAGLYLGKFWELLVGGLLAPLVVALIDRMRYEAKKRIDAPEEETADN